MTEYAAPHLPDDDDATPSRWQKRPPMPAVPPRRRMREQLKTHAEIIEAARYEIARAKRKGLINNRTESIAKP